MQLEALHQLVGEWTSEIRLPGQDAPIAGRTSLELTYTKLISRRAPRRRRRVVDRATP